MPIRMYLVPGIALLVAAAGVGPASPPPPARFAVASVHFEQNVTDGDAEVVFEAKGGAQGLAKLAVVSPDGRTVIDFTAPDASTLGMRQFHFESPEPGDVASLKAAYPAGIYTFKGESTTGERLQREATLHHRLPTATSVVRPDAGAHGASVRGLSIAWTRVADAAAYLVVIEQPELDVSVTARLPESAATFAVPDGFLRPATEYGLALGTVTRDGNVSFVETTFTTGKEGRP